MCTTGSCMYCIVTKESTANSSTATTTPQPFRPSKAQHYSVRQLLSVESGATPMRTAQRLRYGSKGRRKRPSSNLYRTLERSHDLRLRNARVARSSNAADFEYSIRMSCGVRTVNLALPLTTVAFFSATGS